MKIVGGGSIKELTLKQELPQTDDGDEWWQDSVVLVWWDFNHGVGGYHRIGHEPNHRDGPHIALWTNIFTPEWVYKKSDFFPMQPSDRLHNGFGAGDICRFEIFKDFTQWTLTDEQISAQLTIKNYHPPIDAYPKNGVMAKDIAPNHLECAGSVSGSLTIKGEHYEIEGQAFRDHGWGKRIWSSIISHRWIAGVFGPDMSILANNVIGPDGELRQFGCVIKSDSITFSHQIDIVVYTDADGLSHRGGHIKMTLTDGEVLDIECEMLSKGVITHHHDLTCTDIFCKMTCGDRIGFCDFEVSNNPSRGVYRPYAAINAFEKNGFHSLATG